MKPVERTAQSKSISPFLMRAFLTCLENPKLSLEDAMKKVLERDHELLSIVQSNEDIRHALCENIYRRIRNQSKE